MRLMRIGIGLVVLVSLLGACGDEGDDVESTGPAASEFEAVRWDAELEPGVTYRYSLHIHCGMDHLAKFNGTYWSLVDAPHGNIGPGSGDDSDPAWLVDAETILGTVTLIDDATIEYAVPDLGVIGVYAPTDEDPPGCD